MRTANGRNILILMLGAIMNYITLKEVAEKWGALLCRVHYYCVGGCISGTVKIAVIQFVPKNAKKLIDVRKKKGRS